MNLYGLQKLTLLDYPGNLACTVFTGGCNFRCPFCHNSSLVLPPLASPMMMEEEFLAFLQKRKGMLEGVCITGGEPLMQPDLFSFLSSIHQLGYSVKLDTNGSFPDRLRESVRRGLVDYVAMDIKNSKKKYAATAGVSSAVLQSIQDSMDFLLEEHIPYEFRTTIVKGMHTKEDLIEIADWIQGTRRYFLQKFVNSGSCIDENCEAYSDEEMREMLRMVRMKIPQAELRGVD